MALPVYTRTWTHTKLTYAGGTGDARLDNFRMMNIIKSWFVAQGWTIQSSGANGQGYGMGSTDRWNAAVAAGSLSDGWIVLRKPAGWYPEWTVGEIQFSIKSYNGSDHLELSRNVAYGNGSGESQDSRPTVSGAVTWVAATNSLTTGMFHNSIPIGARRCDIWHDASDGAIRLVYNGPTGFNNESMSAIDKMVSPRSDMTSDPWVAWCGNPTASAWALDQVPKYFKNGLGVRITAAGNASGWLVRQTQYSGTLPDGEWGIQKARYWFCSYAPASGIIGEPLDMFFCHPNVPNGTVMPATGSTTHIVHNGLVLPWDNTDSWSA